MRHLQAVMLGLVLGSMGCCFLGRTEHSASMPPIAEPVADKNAGEIVYLDVALIEQPYGARFINYDLWDLGDEQGVNLEMKPVLEENGLRVCQIGGMLPSPLQTLLSLDEIVRRPETTGAEPGKPTAVLVGTRRQQSEFHLAGAVGSRQVSLERAQCLLQVVPTLEDEKRLRLRFTPQIRYGNPSIKPRIMKDPDGPLRWDMEAKEEVEDFTDLHWDCTIGPDEFVVLGTQPARPDTLGRSFFLPEGEPATKQWLLVLRASRVLLGPPVDEALSKSPPLAMQAAWTTARGSSR